MSSSLSAEDASRVRLLSAQYFQLMPLDALALPSKESIIKPGVQAAIYENLFNEAVVWPIPPLRYRSRILKAILARIEESVSNPDEDEISDDLMNCWSDLVVQPQPSPLDEAQKISYVKYTAPRIQDTSCENQTVVTAESPNLILSSGTTGFRTWEAALHLGTYLSTPDGKSLIQGRNVVELGGGTGFISMYCVKHLRAKSVLVTDRDPALISNVQDCMSQNNLDSDRLNAAIWEWGEPLHVPENNSGQPASSFDIAVGADLVYDVDLVPLLLSTLLDLFNNYRIKQFLISATIRNSDTFVTFLKACESNHLHAHEIDFKSPPQESQDGFFHSTQVPIRTYSITQPRPIDS